MRDGVCEPIPPSEFLAWAAATDTVIYPTEYKALRAMDRAYCTEMSKELKDYQERENERMKQEAEAAKSGRRGKR